MKFIAVIPQGFEEESGNELQELGAEKLSVKHRSVFFEADWSSISRIHLYARLPFRFLRQIALFPCTSPKSLYQQVQKSIDWDLWLPPSKTFRVDTSGTSSGLRHSYFSALQVKNAIVDSQLDNWGKRSNINLDAPDISLHLHLSNGIAVLSLATTSKSLHRRGYRPAVGLAPIKENLASGLILKTNWDGKVPLVDPLCGSGTFLIEAVSRQIGTPPGLNQLFLFKNWVDFDSISWEKEEKIARKVQSEIHDLPVILGCEKNIDVANQAKSNISNAGFKSFIEIRNIHFIDLKLPKEKGILICNPPYGKRIGDEKSLVNLYTDLGNFCKKNASGWHLWVLSGNPKLSQFLKMKCRRRIPVSNGGIDCRWLNYEIN